MSSPTYSPPPEIVRVERDTARRLADELKLQLDESKKVTKIWQKECEGLKDKVADKKREGTLAKNEAFELNRRLSTVAEHLGFISIAALLDHLRGSSEPVSLQQLVDGSVRDRSRIDSLESQLAQSIASQTTLSAQLDAERDLRSETDRRLEEEQAAKTALSTTFDALRTEAGAVRKQLEAEQRYAQGFVLLIKEKDDWREREDRMEDEMASLRAELAEAKADADGTKKELELSHRKATISSSQPLGEKTTINSPRTRPKHASPAVSQAAKVEPSTPSKPAALARVEALLESSRAECAALQAKNKQQKDAWRKYVDTVPAAVKDVRAKEERRARKRESRAVSSFAVGVLEEGERSSKRMRMRIESPMPRDPAGRSAADKSDTENQQPSPLRTRTGPVGSRTESPQLSPSKQRSSPPSSPRFRAPTRPSSAAGQHRSTSLVPTMVGSSPPRHGPPRTSSPMPTDAADSAGGFRRTETSAPLAPRSPFVEPPKPVSRERGPHPLGQQVFGPQDLVSARSTAASSDGPVVVKQEPEHGTSPIQVHAGPSRTHAVDSPAPRQTRQPKKDASTPARQPVRAEASGRTSHMTPAGALTPAMREKLSASRPWLGKKAVVNGKATNLDPLDQEIPEGEPLRVHRRTPKTAAGVRPKSDTGPPPSSTSDATKVRRATGSHDSPHQHASGAEQESGSEQDPFGGHPIDPSSSRTVGDVAEDPSGAESDEERRRRLKDPTAGMTAEEKSIFLKKQRNVPVSVTREMYAPFKGRGRYHQEMATPEGSKTINEEFQINKARNDGKDYAFDSVVRGKEARKKLHAKDCDCCRGYYEAVGPLAPLPQGPRWRSPEPDAGEGEDENQAGPSRARPTETEQQRAKRKREEEIDSHRQQISRHRNEWDGPATPPHYWDIGFPSTQKVAMINAAADKLDEEKRARIEAEARKADGRYQRRA